MTLGGDSTESFSNMNKEVKPPFSQSQGEPRNEFILKVRQDLETEDQSLIMELSPLYLERLENARQQGFQQGIVQGKRLMVEKMLQGKFGEVDAELFAIIDALLLIPPLEMGQLILQLSREELLARVRNEN